MSDDFVNDEVYYEPKPKRIIELTNNRKQKLEIIKTTDSTYSKVTNIINELILNGAVIEQVNPVVVNQHFSESRKFSKETEILVFVLYNKEESGNSNENSK